MLSMHTIFQYILALLWSKQLNIKAKGRSLSKSSQDKDWTRAEINDKFRTKTKINEKNNAKYDVGSIEH